MYCEKCKREMDSICKMCGIYRSAQFVMEERKLKDEQIKNNGDDKTAAGPAVCIPGNQTGILHD